MKSSTLAKRYLELDDEKREIETRLKQIKAEMEPAAEELQDMLLEEGQVSIRMVHTGLNLHRLRRAKAAFVDAALAAGVTVDVGKIRPSEVEPYLESRLIFPQTQIWASIDAPEGKTKHEAVAAAAASLRRMGHGDSIAPAGILPSVLSAIVRERVDAAGLSAADDYSAALPAGLRPFVNITRRSRLAVRKS